MAKDIKTNAMRFLENLGIEYEHIDYELDHEFISAESLAKENNDDIREVYKTLATISKDKNVYIFVIEGSCEIDFKKAAKAVGEKSLTMVHLKDLKKTVGYERGATTPLAMKKDFPVIVDEKANDMDFIKVSAGKLGHSIKIRPDDLVKAVNGSYKDIARCD